jgi:20S proteasome subunit beta 6
MNQNLDHFQHPRVINLEQTDLESSIIKRHGKQQWSPYELNGGNVLALAQHDYVIFAADTRLSREYSILHRNTTKIHKLTDETYILSAGMYADALNLWKLMDRKIELFELNHGYIPSSPAIASLLSRTLYEKRFFPFYTFNLVVGNVNGKPTVWNYDAIGSFEAVDFSVSGNGSDMMQSFMDNQFKNYNGTVKPEVLHPDEAVAVVVDIFTSTAEIDTTCGDGVEVLILKNNELVMKKLYPLRSD